ncbi:MAG: ATP-dependent DNA helicase [Desulfomonile tiedjei]|nr:ATP-dependent DNA helicase [Desulfomonile tiedjei]
MDHAETARKILGPEGLLAQSMDAYEHRVQQIEMACRVLDALVGDDRLIIEAPTGTGKTLAYLVAAALSRKRIAISTGTKNLQEQLFSKDIPFLKEKVFPDLKAALLKGRGNFVCHHRFRRFLRQPYLEGLGSGVSVKEILAWYRETKRSGKGDREELANLPDDDRTWMEICSTSETCLGKKCSDRENCFVHRMRATAADADLMVVNHHLLASDLIVRESGFAEVIPRYEALIVDEAHGLEDAVTQHFGFHVGLSKITRLIRDARSELAEAHAKEAKFQQTLAEAEEHARRLFGQFSDVSTVPRRLGRVTPVMRETSDLLGKKLESLASMLGNLPGASDEIQAVARRSLQVQEELQTILQEDRAGDYACWVERRERNVTLHASPVDVGDLLAARLYDKVSSVVFTSATLSSGGDFEYFKSRLGLDTEPPPAEVILDSPFDYACQTMLYIPPSIPDPNSPQFVERLVPALEEILIGTSGRAFVLFTSLRNMAAVHKAMEGRVPFPLLIQGTKPKSRLLEEFRTRMGSVLFATSSFWEGVDVQGEALSCVIVDRLPFAPPDDPIVSARMERIRKVGGDPFYSFQVPMAVIALKQGLGRLIRTRSDRGVLCILDVRILTKPYGKVFLKSLYQTPLHRNPKDIDTFFATSRNC